MSSLYVRSLIMMFEIPVECDTSYKGNCVTSITIKCARHWYFNNYDVWHSCIVCNTTSTWTNKGNVFN